MCAYCSHFLLTGGADSSNVTAHFRSARSLWRRRVHLVSWARRQMSPSRLSRFLTREVCSLLPIVVALILLPPTAFASPPDPSWVGGVYDGADGDDIVSLVYDITSVEAAPRPPVLPPPFLYE